MPRAYYIALHNIFYLKWVGTKIFGSSTCTGSSKIGSQFLVPSIYFEKKSL